MSEEVKVAVIEQIEEIEENKEKKIKFKEKARFFVPLLVLLVAIFSLLTGFANLVVQTVIKWYIPLIIIGISFVVSMTITRFVIRKK
jgi:cytoskeletal protein RodZ